MSHVATVDIEIKDLGALDEACKRIGLEFVPDQHTYKWFGTHVGDYPVPAGFTKEELGHCDHAIRVPGNPNAYEIGVVKRRDGRPGWSLMWDFFAGGYGLKQLAGEDCCNLKQSYAVTVAKRLQMRQGYRVNEIKLPNGKIQLQCSK